MLFKLNVFLICFFDAVSACIPTQQVNTDGFGSSSGSLSGSGSSNTLTTATMTTTTTATEPPFPCNVCQKSYDSSCQGFKKLGVPYCATAAEVGVRYTLGFFALLGFGDSNTCSVYYLCPFPTTSKVSLFGLPVPSFPYVTAYCYETGAQAGIWYYGPAPPIPLPVITRLPLQTMSCYSIGAFFG